MARIEHGRICCSQCRAWYVALPLHTTPTTLDITTTAALAERPMTTNLPTSLLPDRMAELGYVLVGYADFTMLAVHPQWGCSARCATIEQVIASAREMYQFCEYVNRKQREERTNGEAQV